jgi:DNA mismatch endonuclease (patch repair protein)
MSAIRAKNTKPEMLVRQMLHMMGYRFRLHAKSLPGKPDIVIPSIRTILQVKGCFWHGHRCLKGRVPLSNRAYWSVKIAGNKARDQRNERKLRRMGWHVATIWECKIRRSSALGLHEALSKLVNSTNKSAMSLKRMTIFERQLTALRRRRREPKV